VSSVGAFRFVVYFDDDERSDTYAERVRTCPGCSADLARHAQEQPRLAPRPRVPRRGRRVEQEEEAGMLRVLVVDDRADFRQAFAALLEGQPDLEVMGQAGSVAEARAMLKGVDVALLDRGLPDGDGLKLMWPLREANPNARVLVMSATAEMRHPEDAIEAGADGVIDKLAPFERTFAAIRGDGGG
jgi:CheY-like chemotaxis protein